MSRRRSAIGFSRAENGRFPLNSRNKLSEFINSVIQTFSGTVVPGSTSETNVYFPTDTVQSTIHIAWGDIFSPNDMALKLFDMDGNLKGESNYLNLPGLTGKREKITTISPPAGSLARRCKTYRRNRNESGILRRGRSKPCKIRAAYRYGKSFAANANRD
jgi:hypothetical protein